MSAAGANGKPQFLFFAIREISRLAACAGETTAVPATLASIKTWRSPVLLIHGDDDRNVPFSETVHLVEALRNQGVEFEQLIFPDEIHDFLRHEDWLRAYRASADFLDRHLKK